MSRENKTITKIIKMKRLDLGDLFTREEFREQVNEWYFIDSDGFGRYSNENGDWFEDLSPSSFMEDEEHGKNMEYTHVVWFNK